MAKGRFLGTKSRSTEHQARSDEVKEKVEYKTRFLKELSKLPGSVQAQAEKTVFEDLICDNPFDLGYLEQMKGYPGKYKTYCLT